MEHGERKLRVFTWHVHGSYLYYLSQANLELFIPVDDQKSEGCIGNGNIFPFGKNVHEVPVNKVKELSIDCILFQSPKNYFTDQYAILSWEQQALPKIYLEHDPPQGHPTDTPHVVFDRSATIVHVTHFNNLMWNNNGVPTAVIDHGILLPKARYKGQFNRGIVVINNLHERGRQFGMDLFLEVRKYVPLDLIGMNTKEIGGLGEISHSYIPEFISQYRFFFNPTRYSSLGLAVLEAMMVGLPVVGMATTEMVMAFENNKSGFIDTDLGTLIEKMKLLLNDRNLAMRIGKEGKRVAMKRYNIDRFTNDWEKLLDHIVHGRDFNQLSSSSQQVLQPEYEKENSVHR